MLDDGLETDMDLGTYERMLEKGPERFQVKPSGLPAMDHLYDELPNFAEVLDDLSTELGLVDRWEEAEHWRAEAISLWQGLGDPLHEGNSLRMHARALSRLARGAEAREALDRALAVLEEAGAITGRTPDGGLEFAEELLQASYGAERAAGFLDRVSSNMGGTSFEFLDAAVTFAPVGSVVVAALRAVRPGATVAINAIHLDRISEFPYELLW